MANIGLPKDAIRIMVPWTQVEGYGHVVTRLVDTLLASYSSQKIKDIPPEQWTWFFAYKRAPDPPPHVIDADVFSQYLRANSKVWIFATAGDKGGKWMGKEELIDPPELVMGRFRDHARLICSQRARQREEAATFRAAADIEAATPMLSYKIDDGEFVPYELPLVFESWLANNPTADKRLAEVARVVLEKLIQSAEEK